VTRKGDGTRRRPFFPFAGLLYEKSPSAVS